MLQFTQARKRGLFGMPDYMTPGGGIGGGLDGAVQETAPGNPGSSAEPRKKRGLFGSPVVKGIAGTIGDALLQHNGLAPVYAPQMQLRQRMEAEEQQYQRQRQDKRADWQFEQDYERANPKPVNNDTVADYQFIRQTLGEDQAQLYLRNRADPPQYRQGPDGQFYRVSPSPVPQAPVGRLTPLPDDGGTTTPPFGVSGNRLDQITMMSESGGNPNAVSPKGARGLMQVMPETARDPGFGIRPSNGTPADDVRVGREYRRAMQKRYGGNSAKMWGAYNWGPGNLDRALSRHGEDWQRHAPRETQDYIARNLRALRGS